MSMVEHITTLHEADIPLVRQGGLVDGPRKRSSTIELLFISFDSLERLARGLTTKEWFADSTAPGWVVLDVFAHIIGRESELEGFELPYTTLDVTRETHVHNRIGIYNETWVESLSHLDPAAMLDRFCRVTKARRKTLETLSDADFDADTDSPYGPTPYSRYMMIRLFDLWVHEQDIREGLGRPGSENGPIPEALVDEAARMLPELVAQRLPHLVGKTIEIRLDGGVKRRFMITGRPQPHLVVEPTIGMDDKKVDASIKLSSSLFMRLISGRDSQLSRRLGEIHFAGDLDVASNLITNLTCTV